MYNPAHFAQDDPDLLLEVMRQYSFASLISNRDGLPFASHLPLSVYKDGANLRIDGHFARANPHWSALEADPRAMVIFQGPHSYVSPTLYQSNNRVPTWNYIAVHAVGKVALDHSAAGKTKMLRALITQNEPAYLAQFETLEQKYLDGMLNAIIGFSIVVESVEGKFKLGQHRLADDKPELRQQHEEGGENQRQIAQWMQRLGYWT